MTTKIEQPKPRRIFLSYGHDENEEVVRMIKVDLEARGHDVWFDKIAIHERINEKEDTVNFRLSPDFPLIIGRLSLDYSPCARTVNLLTICCCGASDRKISRR